MNSHVSQLRYRYAPTATRDGIGAGREGRRSCTFRHTSGPARTFLCCAASEFFGSAQGTRPALRGPPPRVAVPSGRLLIVLEGIVAAEENRKLKARIQYYDRRIQEAYRADAEQLDREWDEWWHWVQSRPVATWILELSALLDDWERREYRLATGDVTELFRFVQTEMAHVQGYGTVAAAEAAAANDASQASDRPPPSELDQILGTTELTWVSTYNGETERVVVGRVKADDSTIVDVSQKNFVGGNVRLDELKAAAEDSHLLADYRIFGGYDVPNRILDILAQLRQGVPQTHKFVVEVPKGAEPESVDAAWWEGFWKGGKAGFWETVKNLSFEYVGAEQAEAAWREAGLEGTLAQTISQVSSTVAREALLAVFTAGAAQAAGQASQVARHGDEFVKIVGAIKEVYDTVEDVKQIAAAVDAIRAGDYQTAALLVGGVVAGELLDRVGKGRGGGAGNPPTRSSGVVAGGGSGNSGVKSGASTKIKIEADRTRALLPSRGGDGPLRWQVVSRRRSAPPKVHGNSLRATGNHTVYAITDRSTGRVLRFGESGRSQSRASELRRGFSRQGIDIDIRTIRTVEGKAAARSLETRYIQTYRRVYGHRPPFNLNDH